MGMGHIPKILKMLKMNKKYEKSIFLKYKIFLKKIFFRKLSVPAAKRTKLFHKGSSDSSGSDTSLLDKTPDKNDTNIGNRKCLSNKLFLLINYN